MQVFRLVKVGKPDTVIAFDSLPGEYIRTLHMNPPAGLPRHWSRWLQESGSVDKEGKAGFYILDYISTNNDREAWQNIVNFARRVVDTNFRLMDRIEDMATPMSKDSRAEMTIEPEDVPVIPIPKQDTTKQDDAPEPQLQMASAPRRQVRKTKEI